MNETISKYKTEMDEQIRFLHLEIENQMQLSESVMNIVLKSLEKFKAFIIRNNFKNDGDEIFFLRI